MEEKKPVPESAPRALPVEAWTESLNSAAMPVIRLMAACAALSPASRRRLILERRS